MATADELSTQKINLHNPITVNGVTYPAGQGVEVPKTQADDIARMDYDHQQYKGGLNTKHTYEVDAGTMAVGGGAQ
jgi:hypothetical protein